MNNLIEHLKQLEKDFSKGIYSANEYINLVTELEKTFIKCNLSKYNK